MRLETERLVIRNFQATDWEALHEMIVQYTASELAAYDQPWPTAPEEIRKVTEWFASGDSYLAVCLKPADRFVGFVALNPDASDEQRVFNLGYVFNFDYHGHGYATEACRAVLEQAFEARQAQRVVTGTAAANGASRRLLERLGFEKTSESIGSFRQTSDGKPLQFVGYTFELSRDAWKVMAQHRSG
jgi:[ribosomal protein S5]-alanine N-acetyltransferase